jgi:DNA-cytosine methyltransferase
MTLRHASFFSGVGGLDLGFHRAGIATVSLSEIDPYASAVLAERFPEVPNLGDITKLNGEEIPDAEVWSGGFPCQDLSVAGKRRGFEDGTRSSLAFTYLNLVERRLPRWLVLENVPGLFSSNGGRDFGRLIREMVALGYGLAWRTLDARFFGVPQRRRRVFIVAARDETFGGFGAERAAEVLLECEGLCGHIEASREAREETTRETSGDASGDRGRKGDDLVDPTPQSDGVRASNGVARRMDDRERVVRKSSFGHYEETDQGGTLRAKGGDVGGGSENLVAHTLTAPTGGGRRDRIPLALSFPSRFGSNAQVTEDVAQSFAHSSGAPAILLGTSYDGFNQKVEEDGAHRTLRIGRDSSDFVIAGKGESDDELLPVGLDSHRYRCAGNGIVSNVAEWIGRRIVAVDRKYVSGTVAGYAVPEAPTQEAE